MQTVSVCLLGDPLVRDANGPVSATSKKALGLFCYLAYTGVRQSRRDLAALFWGRRNADAARASLRTTLLRMPAPMAACLAIEREWIAATPSIDVDVRRFTEAAESSDVAGLGAAIDLYRGPLLGRFDVDATAEFDDWLARERDRLRQIAQAAFDRAIGLHRERAQADAARAAIEREAALATARRWCEIEPAAEAAHRWVIRLYLEMQRKDAALAQYETCRRELAVAAGRAPGADTQALVERLMPVATAAAGLAGAKWPTPASALRHGLPATSFVGRVDELAELDRLLAEPACRLLTLHALGGTGKSRLAAVLADQVGARFAQGTAWVALEPLTAATQLPQAIALAAGVELAPQASPADALCRALASQQRLLVLDNFEHLLVAPAADEGDAIGLVLRLLREAPDIRLLVTSREVLAVQEEWIYELRGLPFPATEDAGPSSGPYPAVDLFVQRARQAYAGFSVAAEWPHVARLCRLVEGMPLAIELAAAWVRTVPCGDLVGAIDRELRALVSIHRDRPARQQSLDAVVRTSWTLLQPEQQRALAPLCVFAGGFNHEAAAEVADAPLRVLSALADKSLVHRRVDGRMVLHPLVRQFLRETIERDGDAAARLDRRHAAYFGNLLASLRLQLDGARGLDAHAALTVELANLTAAAMHWDPAEQGDRLAEPWLCVLLGRGLQRVALPFADRVLATPGRLAPATRAHVLIHRGVAQVGIGRGDAADTDLASAIELARAHALPNVLATALVHQTLVGFLRDDVGYVEARLAELETVLPSVDEPALIVRAHFFRAMQVESARGDRAAVVAYEETLALAERLEVSQQIRATLQTVLARVLIRIGNLDRAEALLAEASVVHERAGNLPRLAQALNAQATALLRSGGAAQAARAKELAARALALHEQSGHPPGISAASCTLALAAQALGERGEARRLLERAVQVQSPVLRVEAQLELGSLLLDDGAAPEAHALALDGLETALAHDLPSLRDGAALLACAVLVGVPGQRPLAARWLRAIALRQDVGVDLGRHAERRLAQLPPASSADETVPVPIDRAALETLRAALRATQAT